MGSHADSSVTRNNICNIFLPVIIDSFGYNLNKSSDTPAGEVLSPIDTGVI